MTEEQQQHPKKEQQGGGRSRNRRNGRGRGGRGGRGGSGDGGNNDRNGGRSNNSSGRGRGGRGGGRVRGGGGRGGGGGDSTEAANFAGRGPKNFDRPNDHDEVRGNSGGTGGRGGGSGPRHYGELRSRPDRVVPRLSLDDSDDEGGGGDAAPAAEDSGSKPPALREEEQHLDHVEPVNATSTVHAEEMMEQKERSHHAYCLICYSSKLYLRRTITPCGHDDVCWQCHLQMRHLHSDLKCPVCKSSNETLIVDEDNYSVDEADANDGEMVHHKRFDQYQLWGNDLGGGFVFREDVGMHFPNDVYEEHVLPLLGYGCGMPGCEFTNGSDSYVNEKDVQGDICAPVDTKKKQQPNQQQRSVKKRLTGLKALKAHLRIDHGYALCDLCVTNKRDFVSKLSRYTPSGLKKHQSRGDGDLSGFTGHPLCEFCKPLRFYDIVALHEHLNKEHYKCHICEKQGKANQFFNDYARLERHFDREHYLCHEPQCLAARFMVFENEIDLRGHERSFHGTNRRDGGTKIKLEFRVRREGEAQQGLSNQSVPTGDDFGYGLNGEAFVPEALPEQQARQPRQVNEPEISHPLHAARTAELRAQAARMREREYRATAAGAASTGASGGREAFPALDAATTSERENSLLVGWTADGTRNAAGSRLKKTPVGKVTQEEFPSLGPSPGSTSAALRKIAMGSKTRTKQAAGRGLNFSSMASRPSSSVAAPLSVASYASPSALAASVPDMTRNNFPSLGGKLSTGMAAAASVNPYAAAQAHARKINAGKAPIRLAPPPSSVAAFPSLSGSSKPKSNRELPVLGGGLAPNLNANNFPSLGGTSSTATARTAITNPYAVAHAHARKLNANKAPVGSSPPPSSSAAYPALSGPSKGKPSSMKMAFAPTKQPLPMTENMLQLPPPSSAIKQAPPTAQSLQAGKETVESLKLILGTTRYKKLKSLTKDFAMGSILPEDYVDGAASLFDGGIGDGVFWDHIPSLISDIPNKGATDRAMRHLESLQMANDMQELEFDGSGGTGSRKKPINYVLPGKMANSWENSASSSSATKMGGSSNNDSVVKPPDDAAKKSNATSNGSKKRKTKKKNNELRALAFGA
eukprot:CAMPEP_0172527174 /NCGR_PEP_ID=MMETSP1067-20121228/1916_1 /TAXON_ID=265564 ORGANISM="Thalassiosira punctigera, Strain Tpunct2005C2" /NCGR_SAMPLE_ID=MMETSP1067 /ASSEMBLY_ACC=CAM_ASM_000444 /LENGTH=1090 /DNA_ID=CAMNT_0013310853 /DNA_START=130 /DNA_END=3402 /DNA_ORIENTATION=+